MNDDYIDNIIKWENELDCDFKIFMWVDYKTSAKQSINGLKRKLGGLRHLQIYDVNYHIFTKETKKFYDLRDEEMNIKWNTYDSLLLEYQYETGLIPRPEVGDLFHFIKNYGFASDILRLMILSVYGGFYCDVDMEPFNICAYKNNADIKTCPKKLCFSTNLETDSKKVHLANKKEDVDQTVLTTGSIYMDNTDIEAIESLYQFYDNIITYMKRVRKNEYDYIIFNFTNVGIQSTGPQAIPKYETKTNYLYGFYENPRLGAEHSWFINSGKYAIILNLVFQNIFLVYKLRYDLSLNDENVHITPELVEKFYDDFQNLKGNKKLIDKYNLRFFLKENEELSHLYRIYLDNLYGDYSMSRYEWHLNYTYSDLYTYIITDCKRVDSGKAENIGNLKNVLSNFFKIKLNEVTNYGIKYNNFPSDAISAFIDKFIDKYEVQNWESNKIHSQAFFAKILSIYGSSVHLTVTFIYELKEQKYEYMIAKDIVNIWEENFKDY